jgi:hypothetical protein
MATDRTYSANVLVDASEVTEFEEALTAEDIFFASSGAQRGVADATEIFIFMSTQLGILALVFEKLRRGRLPRTYIRVDTNGEFEVWKDTETADGRIFAVSPDKSIEELPDREITAELLARLLGTAQGSGGG